MAEIVIIGMIIIFLGLFVITMLIPDYEIWPRKSITITLPKEQLPKTWTIHRTHLDGTTTVHKLQSPEIITVGKGPRIEDPAKFLADLTPPPKWNEIPIKH